MGSYAPTFSEGDLVRIAARQTLDQFARNWKYHHPLQPDQFAYAGAIAKVTSIGTYHGGDILYALDGIPGIWHEQLIEAV
jgi:hypothetical protein